MSVLSVLCADLLSLTIYRTDAGSLDKNGVAQPAFLNFDAKLRHPPAHEMQVRCRHSRCSLARLVDLTFVCSLVVRCKPWSWTLVSPGKPSPGKTAPAMHYLPYRLQHRSEGT